MRPWGANWRNEYGGDYNYDFGPEFAPDFSVQPIIAGGDPEATIMTTDEYGVPTVERVRIHDYEDVLAINAELGYDALTWESECKGIAVRWLNDIGGVDGLLHISEISWGKIKKPQDVLELEEKIKVKILSMNREKGKISLGLKQLSPEPWSVINENYKVGDIVKGKVVQIKEYGAFVELEPGLDGLVHISQIAPRRVNNIADEVSIGDEVSTKILEIDEERRRISLSMKEAIGSENAEAVEEEAAVEAAEEVEAAEAVEAVEAEAPAEAEAQVEEAAVEAAAEEAVEETPAE